MKEETSEGTDSSLVPHPSSPPRRRRRVSTICTDFEDKARELGFQLIAGVDEVGRGALAGPVVAAAVILDPTQPFPEGLDDSKKLTARQRERIAGEVLQTAVAYAVGQVEPEEIDRINILQASRLAMTEALKQLAPQADYLLIDAVQLRELSLPQKAIIHGDSISASIAAASVLAKTYRDALMRSFHEVFPQYNFARHVGYSTREHLEALRAHGPCAIHRKSFHPVSQGMRDEKGMRDEG
ncbi:MAG TPA: ribonuclease HII [Pyrinomonadaceae bacterium]|nr:ribonuclease HII [Pyrinomonadaceae bacterium]